MIRLWVSTIVVCVFLTGCEFWNTPQSICDSQLLVLEGSSSWSKLSSPPSNYDPSVIRQAFDNDDPVYGTPDVFDNASLIWYADEIGQSAACVVFESSDRVNAYILLSADESDSEPVDLRILGVPFGS